MTPTASEIVAAITSGETSCREHVGTLLEQFELVESDVEAWAHLEPELALETAGRLDDVEEPGPLHGVTVGVKDIVDTHDMPTQFGSPIYEGHRPPRDAACVSLTRRAGGLVLGKTVTTEFANVTPNKTRNPYDAERSPGGSSSGSAAAVAAGMVDIAIGTQTTGSTIRPAAFCGVVGYRPTLGHLTTSGVMQVSASVDTLGILARHVEDVALYRDVLAGVPPTPLPRTPRPRIGFCRTVHWLEVHPDTRNLLEDVADRLAANSAAIDDAKPPADFEALEEAHRWITAFEMSRNLSWEVDNHWDSLSDGLRDGRIRDGGDCSEELYTEMQTRARTARHGLDDRFGDFDVLLTAAVVGEATPIDQVVPHPWLYRAWTLLHVPTVTLPILKGANGLPIGVQLIGRPGADRHLLSVASWIEETLGYPAGYGR